MIVYVKVKSMKQRVKVFREDQVNQILNYILKLKEKGKKYKIIKRNRQNGKFDYAIHVF